MQQRVFFVHLRPNSAPLEMHTSLLRLACGENFASIAPFQVSAEKLLLAGSV